MFRSLMYGAVSVAAVAMATSAFAQQAKVGNPTEAKAMLEKAVTAVKADNTRALASFNAGTDGFKDRDLQPLCCDAKTGTLLATTVPANLGKQPV